MMPKPQKPAAGTVCSFALVLVLLSTPLSPVIPNTPPEPAGEIEFLSADDLPGLLAKHRGKVVLINLWATWCSPCLKEIPDLLRLQARYADQGLVLIAISMNEPEELYTRVIPFRDERFPAWASYQRSE